MQHDYLDRGGSSQQHSYQREYIPSPGPSSSHKSFNVRSPYATLDRSQSHDSAYGSRDNSYSLDRHGHLNVLGLNPGGGGPKANGMIMSNGRSSPYPRDNLRDSYTRKYEERITTNKSTTDEGLYPP